MGSSEMKGVKLRAKRASGSSAAERSAYFARREAAKVLRCVLQGDARRRATASIKSLVYSPSVRNKKATFALVCQTLKFLPVLKNVLAATSLLSTKWKKQAELMYITAYDVLFGLKVGMIGSIEKFLISHKTSLQSALSNICANSQAKNVDRLVLDNRPHVVPKPRYVRVNTLKIDIDFARRELERIAIVKEDDIVPDILVLPGRSDLHRHHMVLDGSIFLQGKASTMVAAALNPKPGWKVLDACAAPGNKTAHLAALLKGTGEIIACEINKKRLECLKDTISRSGAHNVKILNRDFLDINARDSPFSQGSCYSFRPFLLWLWNLCRKTRLFAPIVLPRCSYHR
ncbi:putative methyltransferase [Apostasia shenzhenica]|uniref:Putative methyltransferase n=1 Tax=Apostasia shenzhenica TaxID=1088818 RepID=A0A2I0ATY7_9ASPA|nr:putative methyltransferase [Apostasia shenzhenica]